MAVRYALSSGIVEAAISYEGCPDENLVLPLYIARKYVESAP